MSAYCTSKSAKCKDIETNVPSCTLRINGLKNKKGKRKALSNINSVAGLNLSRAPAPDSIQRGGHMTALGTTVLSSHSGVSPSTLSTPEDWSFAHLKTAETLWGPHGYHRYPAKFIPHLVRRIIDRYSAPGALVGDPFLGSATTGVEALRAKRRFYGSEINPVALLISQAKCRPLEPDMIEAAWAIFEQQLNSVPGSAGVN